MVCYNRKPRLRLAFFFRFSSASNAASSEVLDEPKSVIRKGSFLIFLMTAIRKMDFHLSDS